MGQGDGPFKTSSGKDFDRIMEILQEEKFLPYLLKYSRLLRYDWIYKRLREEWWVIDYVDEYEYNGWQKLYGKGNLLIKNGGDFLNDNQRNIEILLKYDEKLFLENLDRFPVIENIPNHIDNPDVKLTYAGMHYLSKLQYFTPIEVLNNRKKKACEDADANWGSIQDRFKSFEAVDLDNLEEMIRGAWKERIVYNYNLRSRWKIKGHRTLHCNTRIDFSGEIILAVLWTLENPFKKLKLLVEKEEYDERAAFQNSQSRRQKTTERWKKVREPIIKRRNERLEREEVEEEAGKLLLYKALLKKLPDRKYITDYNSTEKFNFYFFERYKVNRVSIKNPTFFLKLEGLLEWVKRYKNNLPSYELKKVIAGIFEDKVRMENALDNLIAYIEKYKARSATYPQEAEEKARLQAIEDARRAEEERLAEEEAAEDLGKLRLYKELLREFSPMISSYNEAEKFAWYFFKEYQVNRVSITPTFFLTLTLNHGLLEWVRWYKNRLSPYDRKQNIVRGFFSQKVTMGTALDNLIAYIEKYKARSATYPHKNSAQKLKF